MTSRNAIEGNFIISLWKNPEYYWEYPINAETDLLTDAGKLYYLIGFNLAKKNILVFDEITVDTFLDNFPQQKEKFQEYGGYGQISHYVNMVEDKNIDHYYDELNKSNLLIRLGKMGFNVQQDYQKFKMMNSSQVRDYYQYILDTTAIKSSSSGIKIEDLVVDQAFIDASNSGAEMGLSYASACPILNSITMGLELGGIFFFCGHSGTFKTSFSFANFLMPVVNSGHKACIISNEQGVNEFKRMLAAMTSKKQFGYKKLTRREMLKGNFDNEKLDILSKVRDYTMANYKGKLFFASMFDYDINKVCQIIRQKSREGVQVFLYDTFKSENMSDSQFWQQLVEDSKVLLQVARKENISVIVTYQLALRSQRERFLDSTCLGTSKGVKEVASQMILSRPLFPDEYPEQKNAIKPYRLNYREKDEDGNYLREEIVLKNDNKYIVMFIEKSRTDAGGKQLLYSVWGDWNSWFEEGYVNINYTG